jgi:hypothetical protein
MVKFDADRPYYQYMYDVFALKQGQPRRPSRDDVPNKDNTKHGSELLLGPEQVLRDKFITSVVDIHQEINQLSVTNQNITITSAIISVSQWIGSEEGDMIDEACLLAGIEVFEQPSSCIDMAAKTAEDQGRHDYVLVLELTYYGLDIYHRQMNAHAAHRSSAMRLSHLGAYRLHASLAKRVIQAFNNPSFTNGKVAWTQGSSHLKNINTA